MIRSEPFGEAPSPRIYKSLLRNGWPFNPRRDNTSFGFQLITRSTGNNTDDSELTRGELTSPDRRIKVRANVAVSADRLK